MACGREGNGRVETPYGLGLQWISTYWRCMCASEGARQAPTRAMTSPTREEIPLPITRLASQVVHLASHDRHGSPVVALVSSPWQAGNTQYVTSTKPLPEFPSPTRQPHAGPSSRLVPSPGSVSVLADQVQLLHFPVIPQPP
jgi:hypothetical protein